MLVNVSIAASASHMYSGGMPPLMATGTIAAAAALGWSLVSLVNVNRLRTTPATHRVCMATAARLAKNRMIDLTKAGVPAVESNEGEYEEPELARFTWAERVEESPYSTELVKVYEISVEVTWGKGPDEVVRIRTGERGEAAV